LAGGTSGFIRFFFRSILLMSLADVIEKLRFVSAAVCLTLGFVTAGFAFDSQPAWAAETAPSLGRTFEKLKKEKKLKIAYFGGSITAGAGASSAAKTSWRALTTAWFQAKYPEAKITELNAAIGGTGSDLGAFRCQRDLVDHSADLVFVEFAVNDGTRAELLIKRSMEGIVRQILTANPWAEIVFVYTTTKALAVAYERGEVPQAVTFHQAIARHYGVAEINVGRELVDAITRKEGTWESWTTDTVHPNDAGHARYQKTMEAFLESHRGDAPTPALFSLPDPLTKDSFAGAHLDDATSVFAPGWIKEEKPLAGAYPHYLATDVPGSDLEHIFTGTTVGIYWLIAPDSGDIEWSIDGGEPKRLSSWDKYALKSSRAGYVILADDLPSAEHKLKIRVLPEKNPQSKGTWIRIGAFLVHCPC
jgi:lysophospholipase L1-like esterase